VPKVGNPKATTKTRNDESTKQGKPEKKNIHKADRPKNLSAPPSWVARTNFVCPWREVLAIPHHGQAVLVRATGEWITDNGQLALAPSVSEK
jgi:hypothetical protein